MPCSRSTSTSAQSMAEPEGRRSASASLRTIGRNGAMTSHGPPRAFICAIDLIVFSHLRWDFVYQRPQHLVSRFSRAGRVLFVEEPIFEERTWVEREVRDGVEIVRPHLDAAIPHALREGTTRRLLRRSLAADAPAHPVVWFYTPMMLPFLDGLAPA